MHRLAVALLIGGVLLLASWVMAGDRPTSTRTSAEWTGQVVPLVADVNAQVDQMRERLGIAERFVAPSRDPFRFRGRPEPRPAMTEPVAPEPGAAPPPMPQLVAILTDAGANGVTRRAVFASGGTVSILKPGDTFDRFVVGRIDADGVELTERATSITVRVSIK